MLIVANANDPGGLSTVCPRLRVHKYAARLSVNMYNYAVVSYHTRPHTTARGGTRLHRVRECT